VRKAKKRFIPTKEEALKEPKAPLSAGFPLLVITFKCLLLTAIISSGIIYSESQGYFESDDKDNHTLKKWDAFYDFTIKNDVDILLVGNSHLYTGINPKNLSAIFGVNSFILASPGIGVIDHYFTLIEALKECKPKVVVIETYGIKKDVPHDLEGSGLSDQLKSFSARRNIYIKLISTPLLFTIDNYCYAWSNTLRNHDFVYRNSELIQKNIKKRKEERKNKRRKNKKKKQLYLGRFVRFLTGLEDSTVQKYDSLGAPVDGKNYETNNNTKYYTDKIIKTCEENNIELIFLTLPMYYKHIANYSAWKDKLSLILGDYANNNWFDLQDSSGYNGFTVECFENSYELNQHMSYTGSMMATYKLADYISDQKSIVLPDKRNDELWRKLFYGEEGFFENNTPNPDDTINIILYSKVEHPADTGIILEILHLKDTATNYIVAKIPAEYQNIKNLRDRVLNMLISYKDDKGYVKASFVDLYFDKFHSTKTRLNFKQKLKPYEILQINNIVLVNKQPHHTNEND